MVREYLHIITLVALNALLWFQEAQRVFWFVEVKLFLARDPQELAKKRQQICKHERVEPCACLVGVFTASPIWTISLAIALFHRRSIDGYQERPSVILNLFHQGSATGRCARCSVDTFSVNKQAVSRAWRWMLSPGPQGPCVTGCEPLDMFLWRTPEGDNRLGRG